MVLQPPQPLLVSLVPQFLIIMVVPQPPLLNRAILAQLFQLETAVSLPKLVKVLLQMETAVSLPKLVKVLLLQMAALLVKRVLAWH